MDDLAIEPVDCTEARIAQRRRIRRDCIEHGLHVGLRAADNTENLAAGCLLFKRLGQRVILVLHVRKQAEILDRNHRLIGKCLNKSHVAIVKDPPLSPCDRNHTNRLLVSDHRNGQKRAISQRSGDSLSDRIFGSFGCVFDVDRSLLKPSPVEGVCEIGADGNAAFSPLGRLP